MLLRRTTAGIAFVLASVLNPAYFAGCGEEEPDWQFDAQDLTQVIDAANGEHELDGEAGRYVLALDLKPSAEATHTRRREGPFHTAHACGQRTLVGSASACIDSTRMGLTGTLTLERVRADDTRERVATDLPVQGEIVVVGTTLTQADASLEFEGGSLWLTMRDGALVVGGLASEALGIHAGE